MTRVRLRYIVLLIALALLLGGTAIGHAVLTDSGSVVVSEEYVEAADGALIVCTLQKPVYATGSEQLPGVLVIHGSLQSKEWLMAFGIELARRGFVVLTMDANGHGESDPGDPGLGSAAALEYLASLEYVDSSSLGIIGHSMGGGHAWRAIDSSPIHVSSVVLVGSGAPRNVSTVAYIPNMLVAVGDFDSLSSYPRDTTRLEASFNVTPVEAGVTYGSFESETARRLFVARTNHLFETIDPAIVSETVEWMKDSLKAGAEDAHWHPSDELVYQTWLFGGLLSIGGAVLTIFPVMAILLGFSFFDDLPERPYTRGTPSYLKFGLLYGVLSLALFYPLMFLGILLSNVVYIPMANATPIVTWLLGTGLISLGLLRWLSGRGSLDGLAFSELAHGGEAPQGFVRGLLRPLLLAALVVGWLYAWTAIVSYTTVLDLRCFLPGFKLLTSTRALFMVLFFSVFVVYFYVEGMWLTGLLPSILSGKGFQTHVEWTLKAVLVKVMPYVVMISIEFVGGLLTGYPLIPGYIGYTFLFFYAFAPWFVVAAAVTMWSYRLTNDYRVGAFVNALICAWLIATILSLPASLA